MQKIIEKINELKKKRNAVILVHNYQRPEVQDIADFLGDSLDLSRRAAETKADTIVFCGVHFMAETAYILNPGKTVLLPDMDSGCPMANMVDAAGLRKLKNENPGVPVVCYINTTAEVKAECDVCCTSANAVKIAGSLKDDKLIFVPDKNLGQFAASKIKKEVIFWNGYCPVHVGILKEHLLEAKREHPSAEVLAHPECTPEVTDAADKVLSTTGICDYVKQSGSREFIIATETGILHRLRKENPDKKFYPASKPAECPNMKKITLEKVLWSLEDMKNKVTVDEQVRVKAKTCIDRMLEIK
jgi:quinolinate synthase